jgi:hypothetical protein
MRNYFLAPRSGEKSYKNFQSTIRHGIPLERIAPYLTPDEVELLSREDVIYAWGNRKGTKRAWEAMQPGDLVFFYAKHKFVMAGEVYFKKHDPDLALAMWPPDEHGNPWAYTFFLRNPKYISIPIRVFNDAVGYKTNNVIQRFTHLKPDKISRILHQYGTIEKMMGLFSDEHSPEVPKENERLYVNVPRGIEPIIIQAAAFTPLASLPQVKGKTMKAKKIDYALRNRQNSITGSRGEEVVMRIERKRLVDGGRRDLAGRIERKSMDDDTLGYDILSFETDGRERLIEVKATIKGGDPVRFFVSSNEFRIGKTVSNFFIYLVENANTEKPRVTIIKNPIDETRFSVQPDGYIFQATRKQMS